MKKTTRVLAAAAALTMAAALAACSGPSGAGETAPSPTGASAAQAEQQAPPPDESPSESAAPAEAVAYRLAVVEWAQGQRGHLYMTVVGEVGADGSVEEVSGGQFLVSVAGASVLGTDTQCGRDAIAATQSLINEMQGQPADLAWGGQVIREVLPTYRFDAPADQVDPDATFADGPQVLELAVGGEVLGERMVAAGLALDAGSSDPSYADLEAQARADGSGQWASCPQGW